MADQTYYTLGFLVTFWMSGILVPTLLIMSPRRLANLMLCTWSAATAYWSFLHYQAVYYGKFSDAQLLLEKSSYWFVLLPPLIYHFTCLMMKQGWNQRASVFILYVLNLSFLSALHIKNFFMGTSNHFTIQFGIFDPMIAILYRVIFWVTLGMSFLRAMEYYSKSIGLGRKKIQYFLAAFPLLAFGFLGAPAFSEMLFGMESKALATIGFPMFFLVMGYAINFERVAAIQNAIPKIFLFALFTFGFVSLSHFLIVSFFNETGGLLPDSVHWTELILSSVAFACLFALYHLIQTARLKLAPARADENQKLILEISAQVLSQPTLEESINLSLEYLGNQFRLEVAAFLLRDIYSGHFESKYTRGIGPNVFRHFEFGKSLIEHLQKKKRVFIVSEAEQTMLPSVFHQLTYAIREMPIEICLPLFYKKGDLAGIVLLGLKPNRGTFSDSDLNVLTVVGTVLSAALEHHKLSDQAMVDGLTRLYHQKYFKTKLDEQIRASNKKRSSMAVIMFDIDYFKKLNDSYGHQAGDRVLESVALTLKEMVRADDVLARYGGEEFALFIQERSGKSDSKPETQDTEGLLNAAERLAEKIRSKVEQHAVIYDNHLFQVTVSVGVGFKDKQEDNLSGEQLIERADQALYFSKQHGRNRVSVATKSGIVERKPKATTPLETELRAKKLGKSGEDPLETNP